MRITRGFFSIRRQIHMYRLLERNLPSFIDGPVSSNPENDFRIDAISKTQKNEEKKTTFQKSGISSMDSPLNEQ